MTIARVFLPFACGYFLSYLYRVVNAVIAPDLVRDLGLDASDLGLLTSSYFLAFAAFQLPLGILLDRFGPRRTEAGLLVFAALGAYVFSVAESSTGLIVGRALIGFGVSACLMAAFKAYVTWFPAQRLPLVNGLQMAAGGLGALVGTAPVEAALRVTDWRGIFALLALATLVVAVAVFTVVPKREAGRARSGLGDQIGGIVHVFTSRSFRLLAPITVATQCAFLSIQSLWSGPWLRDVAGIDRAGVATHLLMIAAAMVAGFVFMGAIAERLGRLGIRTAMVGVFGMGAFTLLQVLLVVQWTGAVLWLWMAFGFFGTSGILTYAALPRNFPAELAGRVITSLNVIVFAAAFAVQWGIGAIIDLWPPAASGGYAPEGYRAAFAAVLGLQVLALGWFVVFGRRHGFRA